MIKTGVTGHVDNILTHIVINNIGKSSLNVSPLKPRTPGFLMFPKSIERGHWPKMG